MAKLKKTSFKDYLIDKLSEEEVNIMQRAFEIVGDIAILEVPKEIDAKSKLIGDAMLEFNSNLKTVLKKSGIHKGEFRTQDLVYVAGENKKETIYRENGIRLKINPETVYFSQRLSTERCELMKNLEEKRVLVMFSGAGPYSFVALKNQPNLKRLTSIEINPEGHRYALDNLDLNRNLIKKSKLFSKLVEFLKKNELPVYDKRIVEILNNLKVNFFCGDVREIVPNLKLRKYEGEINETNDFLFQGSVENIFHSLKVSEKKMLFLDYEKIKNKDNIIYYLTLFSHKFDYVLKINKENYIFDDDFHKGLLINLFENGYDDKNVGLYDEIFMPLPKDASDFLDCAFKVADRGAVVHMYDFVHESEYPKLSEDKVKEASKQLGRKVEIMQTRKVGQYSPRKYRVCCDFKVLE